MARLFTLDGRPLDELSPERIIAIVKQTAPDPDAVEVSRLDQYDRYYLDRTREQPLPVLLARLNDEAHTRYYIDPKTASSSVPSAIATSTAAGSTTASTR